MSRPHPSRRRRGGRGRGRGATAADVACDSGQRRGRAPSTRAATGLTLAEAFHLLSRALGELPAPVPHETLRARMAALHGKEDALLDPIAIRQVVAPGQRRGDRRHSHGGGEPVRDLAAQGRPRVQDAGAADDGDRRGWRVAGSTGGASRRRAALPRRIAERNTAIRAADGRRRRTSTPTRHRLRRHRRSHR